MVTTKKYKYRCRGHHLSCILTPPCTRLVLVVTCNPLHTNIPKKVEYTIRSKHHASTNLFTFVPPRSRTNEADQNIGLCYLCLPFLPPRRRIQIPIQTSDIFPDVFFPLWDIGLSFLSLPSFSPCSRIQLPIQTSAIWRSRPNPR